MVATWIDNTQFYENTCSSLSMILHASIAYKIMLLQWLANGSTKGKIPTHEE